MMIWGACHAGLIMAKSLERPLTNESVLAQFVSDTCVNRIGSSLPVGSSYSTHPDKGLYRAYLSWCNNSDFFPVPLSTFNDKIVIVITDYLKWRNVYKIRTATGEQQILGVAYKHVGAANHG